MALSLLGGSACNALFGNDPVSLWSDDASTDVVTSGDAGAPRDAMEAGTPDVVEAAGDAGVPRDATEAETPDVIDAARDASDAYADAAPPVAVTLVQQAGSDFTTASTGAQASEAFSSPNAAGNTLIVLGFWFALGYSATVSDSLGNTYSSTAAVSNPQGGALQIFYVPRSAAGSNTVTLTMSTGFNNYVGLAIFEYTGLAASEVLEGTTGQSAPAVTASASTPPLGTSASSSLLLAGFADSNGSGVVTPGPGWTALVTNSEFYMIAEAKIVPTTPSLVASATMPTDDDNWVSLMAAFQAAP